MSPGEQDLLTPPWISEEVARAIPGARFEVIRGDGASHLVMLERPEEFNRLVTTFLTEAPASGNVQPAGRPSRLSASTV